MLWIVSVSRNAIRSSRMGCQVGDTRHDFVPSQAAESKRHCLRTSRPSIAWPTTLKDSVLERCASRYPPLLPASLGQGQLLSTDSALVSGTVFRNQCVSTTPPLSSTLEIPALSAQPGPPQPTHLPGSSAFQAQSLIR
jgi:hypothetical protein